MFTSITIETRISKEICVSGVVWCVCVCVWMNDETHYLKCDLWFKYLISAGSSLCVAAVCLAPFPWHINSFALVMNIPTQCSLKLMNLPQWNGLLSKQYTYKCFSGGPESNLFIIHSTFNRIQVESLNRVLSRNW